MKKLILAIAIAVVGLAGALRAGTAKPAAAKADCCPSSACCAGGAACCSQ